MFMRNKSLYFKFCDECGEKFKPTGKTQKVCECCKDKRKTLGGVSIRSSRLK